MGPKKKPEGPSAKNVKKEKERVIEDKTFGLKNKNKSQKVQNYVKSVESQVKHGNQKGGASGLEARQHEEKKKKKSDEAAAALLASLFKNAQSLKGKKGAAEAEVDTKKIDFYRDPRMGTEDMPEDTIITCKFFLDAVEDELYGWRWVCPNRAGKCQYRHMLPEGYVLIPKKERDALKAKEDRDKAESDSKTLEEKIEEERSALKADDLTPVTKESFFAWKERRAKKKQEDLEEKMRQDELEKVMGKKNKGAKGGKNSIMNGRALFSYNPNLFKDDEGIDEPIKAKDEEEKQGSDDGEDGQVIEEEENEDDGQIKENGIENGEIQPKKKKKKGGKNKAAEDKPAQEALVDESLFQGEGDPEEDVDFD